MSAPTTRYVTEWMDGWMDAPTQFLSTPHAAHGVASIKKKNER
jgi:hypothetical protein